MICFARQSPNNAAKSDRLPRFHFLPHPNTNGRNTRPRVWPRQEGRRSARKHLAIRELSGATSGKQEAANDSRGIVKGKKDVDDEIKAHSKGLKMLERENLEVNRL